MSVWRVGSKVPINVYDGDRPVCQCQTALDAALIARAVNGHKQQLQSLHPGTIICGCKNLTFVRNSGSIVAHYDSTGHRCIHSETIAPESWR